LYIFLKIETSRNVEVVDFIQIFSIIPDFMENSSSKPSLKIREISNSGLLRIQFSHDLIPVNNATERINSEVLEIKVKSEFEVYDPFLNLNSWQVLNMTEKELLIQLQFDQPEFISTEIESFDQL